MTYSCFILVNLALFLSASSWCIAGSFDFPPGYFEQVSPKNLNGDIEGVADSLVPFSLFGFPSFSDCDSCRFQQVFAASEFAELPRSGMYIYALTVRPDACNRQGTKLTNLVIRLSTSSRAPDGLSKTFSENVGLDEMVVYQSPLRSVGGNGICVPGFSSQPTSWDQNQFVLGAQFPYSPLNGNLLMDIQYSGKMPLFTRGAVMDAQTLTNDGVSMVYGCPFTAETAQVADTMGLVVQFLFVRPALAIRPSESGITVEWSNHLPSFHLEWSESVAPSANWKSFPGPIILIGEFNRVEIAKAALAKARYYRLFSPTPTPAFP